VFVTSEATPYSYDTEDSPPPATDENEDIDRQLAELGFSVRGSPVPGNATPKRRNGGGKRHNKKFQGQRPQQS
jgi:hypothetical protein